jgi:hypothetical protein
MEFAKVWGGIIHWSEILQVIQEYSAAVDGHTIVKIFKTWYQKTIFRKN